MVIVSVLVRAELMLLFASELGLLLSAVFPTVSDSQGEAQSEALSLVELLHYCALIGRELHALKGPIIGALSDATPALLCHKEPARASKAPY